MSPPPMAVDAFGRPIQRTNPFQGNGYQAPFNPQQPGYQEYNQTMPNPAADGLPNNYQPSPQEDYADPNRMVAVSDY